MKKVIVILTTLVLTVALAACGNSAAELYAWEIGPESSLDVSETADISLVEGSQTPTGVKIKIHNPTEIRYCYGAEFSIEVWQDNAWYTMTAGPGLDATAEERFVDQGASKEEEYSWPSALSPGKYRLLKELYPEDSPEHTVWASTEFIVE